MWINIQYRSKILGAKYACNARLRVRDAHEMRAESRVISINELAYCLSIVADVLLVLMAV